MMKKCCFALMAMLVVLVAVGFAACGHDEPEVADIVGTWTLDTDLDGDFGILFQFTKDGKYHEVQTYIIDGEESKGDVFHGTYTVSGHKLVVTYLFQYETETVEYNYDVEGDKLTIYFEGTRPATFHRVKDSVIEPYL